MNINKLINTIITILIASSCSFNNNNTEHPEDLLKGIASSNREMNFRKFKNDSVFFKEMEKTHKIADSIIFNIVMELSLKEFYLMDTMVNLVKQGRFKKERRPRNKFTERYFHRLGKQFGIFDSIIEEINYDYEMQYDKD
jgi:hypothetical protein